MVDRSVVIRLGLDPSAFNRGLAQAAVAGRAFTKELDSADNSFSRLLQTGLALGPSLVPIAAAASGAVLGLANALGAAVLAGGTAVFAFNGVGDALKALSDFQVDPTAEHFQKLQETMAELGPEGQRFVLFLNDLQPEIEKLQATAQAGLFPGIQEGIESLMPLLPQVQDVVTSLSTAVGDMAAEGGDALASPFWRDFLDFIATDGRDALMTLGETLGNLVKASAGLVEAFDPLSDDIGSGLLDFSQRLADSTENLDENQGFQDFVAYVRDVGPDAVDALAALGEAFIEISKAAAPVGAASLPIIEALADAISAIAASPVGPVLIGVASGLSAISRAVALYNATSGSALSGFLFGKSGQPGIMGADASKTAGIRGFAGALGVLALSLTDLDDAAGISNTLNFAALGSIAGPWGAAIGGTVGALKDAAEANNDVMESIENVGAALQSAPDDWQAQNDALDMARMNLEDFKSGLTDIGLDDYYGALLDPGSLVGKAGSIKNSIEGLFGDSDVEEATKAFDEQADAVERVREAQAGIANALAGGDFWSGTMDDLPEITAQLEKARPAMDAVGVSLEDLINLQAGNPFEAPQLAAYLGALGAYAATADTTAGRTQGVIDAISGMDDEFTTAADSAKELQAALEGLFSPGIDLQRATDAYAASLDHLEEEVAKNSRSFKGQTDAARTNREAFATRTELIKDMLVAQAQAGASSDKLTRSMQRQRERLVDAGEAAGFNRDEVRDLLKSYDLTPKLVKTIIEAQTDDAKHKLADLDDALHDIDRTTARPTVILNDAGARAQARALQSYINGLSATITVNVQRVEQRIGVPDGSSGDGRAFKDGGVVRYYAAGGVEHHVAQIAPAGSWRVWGEPETGGEAYIPLALRKRGQSKSIVEEVVRQFGGSVSWLGDLTRYATGGFNAPAPVVNVGGSSLSLSGMRVQIDTGRGTFWGTVRDVARQEVDDNASYAGSRGRQR